jgi:four helix bundle protein
MSAELENRFLRFAIDVRNLCAKLRQDVINIEFIKQLIRSSSSIGANYIEGSDPLGKADEKMKLKTARREAKEALHFIPLLLIPPELDKERTTLLNEASEIKKILSAIVLKMK